MIIRDGQIRKEVEAVPCVYLIESSNATVLSRTIRLFSNYPFNHLSISLDESLSEVYSFGRKQPNNPLIGGFVQEDFQHPFYTNTEVRVYALEMTKSEWAALCRYLEIFKNDPSVWRYNFLGLIPAYFNISWTREHHYFCSQFVATLFKEVNLAPSMLRPECAHPKDVIEALQPLLVYEGRLWDYAKLSDNKPLVSDFLEEESIFIK